METSQRRREAFGTKAVLDLILLFSLTPLGQDRGKERKKEKALRKVFRVLASLKRKILNFILTRPI